MPRLTRSDILNIDGRNGVCPSCNRASNFELTGDSDLVHAEGWVIFEFGNPLAPVAISRAAFLSCYGCGDTVVCIEQRELVGLPEADFQGTRQITERNVGPWQFAASWPTPGMAEQLDPSVPREVAKPYAEALRSLAAGSPNAGTAMFRVSLAELINIKGSEGVKKIRFLDPKLKAFVREGGFGAALEGMAEHVKLYGNAGGHPDVFGEVSMEEAFEVAALMQTLIQAVFVWPATMERRQAERRPSSTPNVPGPTS